VRVPAITPDRLAERAPLEAVVVAVKVQDTRRALEQLLPHSTLDTFFVSMQAGMNLHTFAEVVGPCRTIGADPNYGGVAVGPGHLEAGFPNYIHIGELDGSVTPRLQRLQRDMNHWTPTHITDNILGTVWSKFVYGSQIMCTAMTDRPSGEALATRARRLVGGALVAEAMRVSDALGIDLEPFDFFDPEAYRVTDADDLQGMLFWIEHAWPRHEVFRRHSSHAFANTGSIWRWDIVHQKRPSEATAFVDTLRTAALQVGLEIPLNDALQQILREIERGERPMADENFDELASIVDREGLALPSRASV
jgi:2-dehydropantoate 2-reductase